MNPNAVFKILYLSKGGKCCIYKISNLSLLGEIFFLFPACRGVLLHIRRRRRRGWGGTGLFNRVKWAGLSGQAAPSIKPAQCQIIMGDRCHYSMKICM